MQMYIMVGLVMKMHTRILWNCVKRLTNFVQIGMNIVIRIVRVVMMVVIISFVILMLMMMDQKKN